MQRNFVITDVMKTGNHVELEQFFSMHTLPNQSFDCTGEFYTLHHYDLDSYDRRFAVIDVNYWNEKYCQNKDFNQELARRCKLLQQQGFTFIKASVWESKDNVENSQYFPEIELEHIKWTGGVSYFWFHMYNKHIGHDSNFNHSDKKLDFLYLNKTTRPHREQLYEKMLATDVLDNSLYTFRNKGVVMPQEYELPGIKTEDYPNIGKDQDIFAKPYNDTKYSLISETNDNDYEVFMTEKIWKPIIAEHVFIVHGNYLYLQKLREMGFKTFSKYFDEGYDLEKDTSKRTDKLVALCKDLKSKNWHDIYLQTQALRKHNHDTFFNKEKLCIQINATIELFLEFADSSQVPS